jgi:glucose-6-phosphate isomerase
LSHHPPPTSTRDALDRLVARRFASRLFQRDPAAFAAPDAPEPPLEAIAQRLGWIDAARRAGAEAPAVLAFAREVRDAGLRQVYLLGMGGSSLCAEVLRDSAAPADRRDSLVVLDTTDERAVGEATAALDPETALFIVASKSGSTIEVTTLERHFREAMLRARGEDAGRHFVAITDPATPLAALAQARAYRAAFLNPADIGGRYSALSLFGLVPAALLGVDVDALAASAATMAEDCAADDAANPGLALGAFMAGHARTGRDKLTVVGTATLAPLGPWIEQLVAESTGKEGAGVLPVVGERAGAAGSYGADRAFVTIEDGRDPEVSAWADAIAAAGHPVFRIATSAANLGGEFLRWEVATAAAGAALGVNPFDEPNVREAKARTQAQLDAFTSTGLLRVEPPLAAESGCRVREHRGLNRTRAGRYVALLDYLPVDPARLPAIDALRVGIRERTGMAVTHGIGPRYLHSTGQYHKGGPDTGLFVLLTSDDATITVVPETGFSFSVLKHAQALGDFDALAAAGRDVLHLHFADPAADVMPIVTDVVGRWLDR